MSTTTDAALVDRVLDRACTTLVVLTLYVRADIAVCGRLLQILTVNRFRVERFVADFSPVRPSDVRGLEDVNEPMMQITVALGATSPAELERFTKRANRMVDVFKVIVRHRI